jgi:hypothetical protein
MILVLSKLERRLMYTPDTKSTDTASVLSKDRPSAARLAAAVEAVYLVDAVRR